jgi:hypothetical protein
MRWNRKSHGKTGFVPEPISIPAWDPGESGKRGSLGAGTLPYGCLFFLMLAAQIVTGHSRNTEGVHVHA